jgi:hypothetical protein
MKKSVIMVLALTALFGCSKMEQEVGVDANGNPIGGVPVKLTGVIETVSTRANGVVTSIPSGGLELSVFRANKVGTTPAYSGYSATPIAGVLATGGVITLSPTQSWSKELANKSSFIAIHHNGKFTYSSGILTLDGHTDVMSSTLVEGDKDHPQISLKLKHLLARADVKVVTKSGETVDDVKFVWGEKVTGVELVGQNNSVTLTLPTPQNGGNSALPTFSGASGNVDFALTTLAGDATAEVTLNSTVTDPFGYVMFLPGTQELEFRVRTTFNTTGSTASSASTLFEAGKRYLITISLSETGFADGVAVEEIAEQDIIPWDDSSNTETDVEFSNS